MLYNLEKVFTEKDPDAVIKDGAVTLTLLYWYTTLFELVHLALIAVLPDPTTELIQLSLKVIEEGLLN